MIKVVSVKTMRESDRQTIASGISGIELMRRAAEGIYRSAQWRPPVAIVCGTGNNGGDGYAVANILHDNGIECMLFLLQNKFSEDGKHYFDLCKAKGIPYSFINNEISFSGYHTILDCLYGTGFHGEADGLAKEVIQKINASGAYIVSADINSGLGGECGIGSTVVVSDLTVSVGDYKPGHFLNMAKDVIKSKVHCDIGIQLCRPSYSLVEAKDIMELFLRKHYSNKGTYGYVALIGGSVEYSGAAKLANLACSAMRAGAGVTKLAVPSSIAHAVMPTLLESTLFPLKEREGRFVFNEEQIADLLYHTKACAVGMGIGQSAETEKLISYLLANYIGTLIIDADGLNTLAKMERQTLLSAKCKMILTPHLLEFSRLSGLTKAEILVNPIEAAKSYADAVRAIVVLKGPTTIITDGVEVFLVDRGCAGMATAGSGDVLSGILAGIAGFCNCPLTAAYAGAYINGLAGELAESKTNAASMLAGDTANSVAEAVSSILNFGR